MPHLICFVNARFYPKIALPGFLGLPPLIYPLNPPSSPLNLRGDEGGLQGGMKGGVQEGDAIHTKAGRILFQCLFFSLNISLTSIPSLF